jgi:Xaa-Pro aminopeptidase
MDFDSGKDWIFGNDVDMGDIIWMGPQPTVKELAAKCGVTNIAPVSKLESVIREAVSKKENHPFSASLQGRDKNDAWIAP